MNRLRSLLLNVVDFLLLINALLIVIILLSGGFAFSLSGAEISMHQLRNPGLILGMFLILRKLLDMRCHLIDIPMIRASLNIISKRFSPMTLVMILAGGYALGMSTITTLKHLSYNSYAFDLGVFDQIIWNTAHGDILYSSILGGRHFFSEHFSPILFLLVPLYWIYAHPVVLLILQSCALASGAVPVYWLAKKRLNNPWLAVVFVWLYVSYRPIRNVNLFDFHPIALTTPLLLFAFWFLDQRKYALFGVFLILALGCKEEISTIVFIFGVYIALVSKKRLAGGLLALAGIIVFFVEIGMIIPYYRQAPFAFIHRYDYLGSSIPEILQTLVLRPVYVAQHVLIPKKIEYVFDVFGPVGFLSFLSPSHLLLTIPTFFQNILSNSESQYTIGYQYTAPLTPFVFISAIYGARKLLQNAGIRKHSHLPLDNSRFIPFISSILLILSLVFLGSSPISHLRQYQITSQTRLTDRIIQEIPASASVSAQNTFVPHLSHRKIIYEFPVVNAVQYIFLDIAASTVPLSKDRYIEEVENVLQAGEYGVILMEESLLLLKRGYSLVDNERAISKLRSHP